MAARVDSTGEDNGLATVIDVYRGAVREERLAREHRGYVSVETRKRLQTIRDDLRSSLEEADREPLAEVTRRLRLLAEIDGKRHRNDEEDVEAALEALVRIHEGLVRLRQCATPPELIERAPFELIQTCGFTRAMISRVRGSLWVPDVLELADEVDADGDFREFAKGAEIPLAHMLLETDLLRRRSPVLVTDPVGDPRTYKPIVEVSHSTSYAAAPILTTNRVIGFLHVDRYGQNLPMTPQDRDNLWVFAEHFGLLYERSVLVERLESQRSQLLEALATAASTIDEIVDAEIELARNEPVADFPSATSSRGSRSKVDLLLTAREQEVLDLMASGATNTQIGQALIVAEGTVKSHVKRILRKLRVSNRSEAVARYLHLIQSEQRAAGR
jgi:DNA-binding CsgD family transcriptional regulator